MYSVKVSVIEFLNNLVAINEPVTDKGLVIEGLVRQPPLGNHLTSGLLDIRVDRFFYCQTLPIGLRLLDDDVLN